MISLATRKLLLASRLEKLNTFQSSAPISIAISFLGICFRSIRNKIPAPFKRTPPAEMFEKVNLLLTELKLDRRLATSLNNEKDNENCNDKDTEAGRPNILERKLYD